LGNKTREWREQHSLTQEEFAEEAGVSRNAIGKLESKRTLSAKGGPELKTLLGVAKVLKLSLSQLFASVEKQLGAGETPLL
jgi:transcriptional regulator with XRE-family HTH domain